MQGIRSGRCCLRRCYSNSICRISMICVGSNSVLVSPSQCLIPPLSFRGRGANSIVLSRSSTSCSRLLQLAGRLVTSFGSRAVPGIVRVRFCGGRANSFMFKRVTTHEKNNLVGRRLTTTCNVSRDGTGFLLRLNLISTSTGVAQSSRCNVLLRATKLG